MTLHYIRTPFLVAPQGTFRLNGMWINETLTPLQISPRFYPGRDRYSKNFSIAGKNCAKLDPSRCGW